MCSLLSVRAGERCGGTDRSVSHVGCVFGTSARKKEKHHPWSCHAPVGGLKAAQLLLGALAVWLLRLCANRLRDGGSSFPEGGLKARASGQADLLLCCSTSRSQRSSSRSSLMGPIGLMIKGV